MATYIWICLLLVTVTCNSQASPFSELPSVEPACSQSAEQSYYASLRDYGEPCQRLGAAMVQFRDILIALVQERSESMFVGPDTMADARADILKQTGVDIEQDQDILDFACRLANVGTTDSFAELINAEREKRQIAHDYRMMLIILARIDGFHGFRMGNEVLLAATEAFRELVGQTERPWYMDVDEVINSDALADLLARLEEQFGSGYLIYGTFYPYNEALVGVDHHVLADAIKRIDVQCALGMTGGEFDRNLGMAVTFVGVDVLSRELVDILLELYLAAEQAGLFRLL